MSKTSKVVVFAVVLVAIALGAGAYIWMRASGSNDAMRLLPDGDVLVYANLRPLHLVELTQSFPPPTDPEYLDFVQQTGIQLERDLDEFAFALQGSVSARDTESSEILTGRFDRDRLSAYLAKSATGTESFGSHKIFLIAHSGHTVRVCLLTNKMVAITNMESAEPMQTIIRHAEVKFARSLPGPALLSGYYKNVPVGSVGWVIGRIPASGTQQMPSGFDTSYLENGVVVASVRYTGDVLLKTEVLLQTEDDAKRLTDAANGFVGMYRTILLPPGNKGGDAEMKSAINSIKVEQKEKSTIVTATIPQKLIEKLGKEIRQQSATHNP
ncbi:MAG TPA: hypothetical protein VEW69_04130 [Alphaproteobacteria bacterium]|nr:hypothetical protein [Alphaproteobacteria bacterium]